MVMNFLRLFFIKELEDVVCGLLLCSRGSLPRECQLLRAFMQIKHLFVETPVCEAKAAYQVLSVVEATVITNTWLFCATQWLCLSVCP